MTRDGNSVTAVRAGRLPRGLVADVRRSAPDLRAAAGGFLAEDAQDQRPWIGSRTVRRSSNYKIDFAPVERHDQSSFFEQSGRPVDALWSAAPVTHRHEVFSQRSVDEHNRQILSAIASGQRVTQRSLSKDLGVALGLTNLLVRRLVAKGYVRVARLGTRHVRYLMTAKGWEALAEAARDSLENTVHLYTQTREQIRGGLSAISERCEKDGAGQKRVLFYGAGDVAEIAYVSLQSTDLTLVGVVDDQRTGRFFHLSIRPPEELFPRPLEASAYGHVIITSFRHQETIRARIDSFGVPKDRVSCL